MLNAINVFSKSNQNGLFINSCFAHCQSERQDTWYENDSPRIGNKVCPVYIQVHAAVADKCDNNVHLLNFLDNYTSFSTLFLWWN